MHWTYSTQFVFGTTLKIDPVVCVHGSHVCELMVGISMLMRSNMGYEEEGGIIIALLFALAMFEQKMCTNTVALLVHW